MRTAVSPPTTAPIAKELSVLTLFRETYGTPHLMLAYHAALPLALTPDLLYGIWANFQTDVASKSLDIPWIAVSDLLLSGLCEVVGHELYKLNPKVRETLLDELSHQPNLGKKRILELASFLKDKVRNQLSSEDLDVRDFAQAQQWVSLVFLCPHTAAQNLLQVINEKYRADRADAPRISSIINMLSDRLSEFPELLIYAQGVAAYTLGKTKEAKGIFDELHQQTKNTKQLYGVYLPVLEELASLSEVEVVSQVNKRNDYLKKLWNQLSFFHKSENSRSVTPKIFFLVASALVGSAFYFIGQYQAEVFNNPNRESLQSFEASSTPQLMQNLGIFLPPEDKATYLVRQGDRLLNIGRYSESLSTYDEAVDSQANYAPAHLGRCKALTALKQPSEAINACDSAIAYDSYSYYPEAVRSKGNAEEMQGKLLAALQLYEETNRLMPAMFEAWLDRSRVLQKLGRSAEAIEAVDQAIARNRESAEAWTVRGEATWTLQRYDQSIIALEKALQIDPNYVPAINLRQNIRRTLGR